jgi:isochorismate hydrolase
MTDEKWRSPHGHAIASDVTDKQIKKPPENVSCEDLSNVFLRLKDAESLLKSAIIRVAHVREWCKISGLPNVAVDMQKAEKELSQVIYHLQNLQKLGQQNDTE